LTIPVFSVPLARITSRVSSEIIIPPLSLTLLYGKFHRQCVNKDYLYLFFLARYANSRHDTIRVGIIIIIINALAIIVDTNRQADSSGLGG
jgi:hypothetical protein